MGDSGTQRAFQLTAAAAAHLGTGHASKLRLDLHQRLVTAQGAVQWNVQCRPACKFLGFSHLNGNLRGKCGWLHVARYTSHFEKYFQVQANIFGDGSSKKSLFYADNFFEGGCNV